MEFENDLSLIEMFEQQVETKPKETALVMNHEKLTYQQLDEQANQLANFLLKEGISTGDLIGVCLDRSINAILAILGILKSGAAFVPIDPAYPVERMKYIITDTQAKIVISTQKNANKLKGENIEFLLLDKDKSKLSRMGIASPKVKRKQEDLVYVIYTSGSTGRPKGVAIEEHSLMNYLLFSLDHYKIENSPFNFPLFTSLSFDLTQTAIFLTLLSGGKLTIKQEDDLSTVLEDIARNPEINAIKLTPSHCSIFPDLPTRSNISFAIIGGEQLEKYHLKNLIKLNPDIRIFNEYGPTEATIGCVVSEIENIDDPILIGKPIANTQIYIIDENESLVSCGVIGELCIAGAGLARGYINQPELTKDRFFKSSFLNQSETLVYRTGDFGYWLPNGNINLVGRKDDQVKIRGYRIEMGEVENAIQQYQFVDKTVVLDKLLNGHKQLIAYVVGKNDFDKQALKTYLNTQLPSYMIPSIIVEISELPLTTNGKVDKKSLPDPDFDAINSDGYVAPITKVEKDLANIWSTLLNVKQVGLHSNFFELGGDSIMTIQVASRAKKLGYHINPKDVFINSTIAALAKAITNTQPDEKITEQGLLIGPSNLLPIQHWFFEHNHPNLSHFNQSVLLNVNQSVEAIALEKVLHTLIVFHDALRFKYEYKNGQWNQIYGPIKAKMITVDLSNTREEEISVKITEVCTQYQSSLDLKKGELFKPIFIKTPNVDTNNRLFFAVHHLVTDGVSWRILLEQLKENLLLLAEGKEIKMELKGSSYRQWGNALSEYATTSKVMDQQTYWQAISNDYIPLPVEFSGAQSTMKDMHALNFSLSADLTQDLLKNVNKAYHTEINDLLLASLAYVIARWSKCSKVIIGLEGHGREELFSEIDTTNTVGWFTNLYPLSLDLPMDLGDSDLIKSVKEQLRRIPEKGMGYGLLRYLHPSPKVRERLSKINWDIVFNYLGQIGNSTANNGLISMASENEGNAKSEDFPIKEKLIINAFVVKEELSISIGFSKKQYRTNSIQKLGQQYIEVLTRLIRHCIQKEFPEFTPSDYNLNQNINYKELDNLNQLLTEKEVDGDEILKF